jgi:RNA polymerase sigma-70 factor (ECF subfamily)
MSSERVRQEQALRGAVVAGKTAAWRTLYDGAYRELWAYIVWRCGGLRDLAEEVTQETWLVAVRRIADFDPRQARFLAWLRGIAANVIKDQLRRRQRRAGPLSGQEMAPDDAAKRDEAEMIAQALAELSDRQEAVLRAKYLDLESVAQIAADWDETPKAIESLLTRARQSFRNAYERLSQIDIAIKEPSKSRSHE